MKPIAYNSPATLNAICLGMEDAKNLSLNLERQGMLTLPASAPANVSCLEGALWITLDNDSRDIVLNPGEAFTTPGGRRAIVYALKPSRIKVMPVAVARSVPVVAAVTWSNRKNWVSLTPTLRFAGIAEWS